jgi:hypothetical protein
VHLQDNFGKRPTGRLAYGVYRRGVLIDEVDDENLIVIGSQFIQAQLLGGTVANNSLTKIGFGTSGAATTFANTALTAAYVNALAAPLYPASNQVSFAFALAVTEANGLAISEFGLLSTAGLLYARKNRSAPIAKDTDISLAGTWVISF